MIRSGFLALALVLYCQLIQSQSSPINRQQFFLDENVIEATLTTDIKQLRDNKKTLIWQPADVVMRFSDTSAISEKINVRPRGIYRKNYCDLAALMLNFKNTSSPKLSPLKRLKLVGGCRSGSGDETLLLKEYLVYKIYNFLSPMSFRVRLVRMTYNDSKQKVKSYSQYAFLIEDMKDLADRNNCKEVKNKKFNTEATDRKQMNFVSIFEYMIGNTDWAVPVYHNIKLMVPKNDSLAQPYPIAYDFDYAGIVNASYAVPDENLEIKFVTERVYRGFPRNIAELELNLDVFRSKKEQIFSYLNDFTLLNANHKKQMVKYLEEFYEIIESKKYSKTVFIDNARTQ